MRYFLRCLVGARVTLGVLRRDRIAEMLEGLARHLRSGAPLRARVLLRAVWRRMVGAQAYLHSPPCAGQGRTLSPDAIAAARDSILLFAEVEPDLGRLRPQPLEALPVAPATGLPRDRAWHALIGSLQHGYHRLILVPSLVRGGAERVALNFLRAAQQHEGLASTLLVVTDHARVDALDWLPSGTHLRILGEGEDALSGEDRVALVTALIHSLQPEVVLNVNSAAGWDAFARHGRALGTISRLQAGLFCPDYDARMLRGDYGYRYLRTCLPHLSTVYCDNASFARQLATSYGLPPGESRKLRVVYQPYAADELRTAIPSLPRPWRRDDRAPRVLWASRIAHQKNPGMLPQIARRLPGFRFDIRGAGEADLLRTLRRSAPGNLALGGPYGAFGELAAGGHDIFLYTARWDGIPNVLLEAGAAGLPIVAPLIGGIGELIDTATGWPIPDPSDVESYVAALQAIAGDPEEAARRAARLQALIATRHGWEAFRTSVSDTPGFLLEREPERQLVDAHG